MRQKVILKNLFEESTVQFQPDKICPHVCLWRIHFDIWQNQYNIVKFKNKIKLKKKKKEKICPQFSHLLEKNQQILCKSK